MFDLYASPTPNVLKVLIALEELGLAYRIRPVDVWRGQQFDAGFTSLNPNAKVPVLVDLGDPENPYPVFESGAILLYLAERGGPLIARSGFERAEALQWLFFQTAGIGPISGQFNHFAMFAPPGTEYSLSRYATELRRLYAVLDTRLADVPFLAGANYGIADIAVFPWVRNQALRFGSERPFLNMDDGPFPALVAWYRNVAARAAVERAIAAFMSIESTLKLATPDELDRVFGRGRYAADTA